MDRIRREVELVASTDLPVLISGETGTGKELVARFLHAHSRRRNEPLVYVNCAALPESIAESELFGHVRGAFTGANRDRKGKFELAHNATLFLDEVGELSPTVQTKLLRAIQFGEVQRVGSDEHLVVDVRVIAATNCNVLAEVAAGRLRRDLYHRLNAYPIHMPALRDRREDIALIASYLLDRAERRLGLRSTRLAPAAMTSLKHRDWPGNIRELDHVLTRAALRASEGRTGQDVVISEAELEASPWVGLVDGEAGVRPSFSAFSPDNSALTLQERVDAFKRHVIEDTLRQTHGCWAEAARRLGVDRGNLHHTAQRLGLR